MPSLLWALAACAPLAAASPLRPRTGASDADITPTPTNSWGFPGVPTVTIGPDPVYPGGPINPDPVYPGGSINPDPIYPGGPINPDPVYPGGPINPDPVYPGGPINPDPIYPGTPLTPDPVSPGGDLDPDPVYPGGAINPDPTYPGGAIDPDPESPGGAINPDPVGPGSPITPDEPVEGDGDSFGIGSAPAAAARAVADDPPPTFTFGQPWTLPTIFPDPVVPGGSLQPGNPGEGGPIRPDDPGYSNPFEPWLGGGKRRRRDAAASSSSSSSSSSSTVVQAGPPTQRPIVERPLPYNPGGPMKAGRGVRSAQDDCTYTLTPAGSAAATAAPVPPAPCAWNGVLTVYTSTTTVLQAVDCRGCAFVDTRHGQPRFHGGAHACPNRIVSTSTTATTPQTVYATVCAASAATA